MVRAEWIPSDGEQGDGDESGSEEMHAGTGAGGSGREALPMVPYFPAAPAELAVPREPEAASASAAIPVVSATNTGVVVLGCRLCKDKSTEVLAHYVIEIQPS